MTMIKYGKSNLWSGEMSELLHGKFYTYNPGTMPWFTKNRVLFTIKNKWDFDSFNIRVNKILWDSDINWTKLD